MKNVIEKDGKLFRKSFYKVFNEKTGEWERKEALAQIVARPRPPVPAQMTAPASQPVAPKK